MLESESRPDGGSKARPHDGALFRFSLYSESDSVCFRFKLFDLSELAESADCESADGDCSIRSGWKLWLNRNKSATGLRFSVTERGGLARLNVERKTVGIGWS